MSTPLVPVRAKLNGKQYAPAGVIHTVDGTMYPGAPLDFPPPGAGFSSDMAYSLMNVIDGLWIWEGIGYQAAIYPMGKSAQAGRTRLTQRILRYPLGTKHVITGYSQGAMAVGYCWVNDILAEDGVLHDRYINGDFVGVFNFGDPLRCPGIANGNKLIGQPLPPKVDGEVTGGIGGKLCLTPEQTTEIYYSFVNPGDLYADCPVGLDPWNHESKVGRVETGIFNIVQHATFLNVVEVAEDLFTPIATVEAIINGIKFAAEGANAPHWRYQEAMAGAVAECVKIGNRLPHQLGV